MNLQVNVHRVEGKEWRQELYKQLLGADNPNLFLEALEQVKLRLKKAPVLVLDIPRSTTEGMDRISSFAKTLSTDMDLLHARALLSDSKRQKSLKTSRAFHLRFILA